MSKHKTPIRNLAVGSLVAAVAGAALLLAPAATQAASWNVDQAHTEINFSIKHFFTPVTGSFDDYKIDLSYDADNLDDVQGWLRIARQTKHVRGMMYTPWQKKYALLPQFGHLLNE